MASKPGGTHNGHHNVTTRTLLLLHRQPVSECHLTLLLCRLVGLSICAAYTVYLYFTYFQSEMFTRYPDPIAQTLRKALYFSNMSPDPPRALKYWKLALEQCDEHGLDYFSDDVMGIKIRLAQWLEETQNFKAAIKVLETVLSDCKRWVDVMEKAVADGTAPLVLRPPPPGADGHAGTTGRAQSEEPVETIWGKRTRVLGKAVQISNKLAELYSDEHILESETAHEHLTWGVSTALGELRRRTVEGLKEGEGYWLDADQIGGSMECEDPSCLLVACDIG